jgi:acetyl esterase/lipase
MDMLAAGTGASAQQEITAEALRRSAWNLANAVDVKNVRVAAVEDLSLEGPGGPLRVRIYTPEGAGPESAGLVYFHGGMGVFGGLDTHDGFCRLLANSSACRIVSVDYRKAPEHPFPAALEDTEHATRWVFEHAAELGIDRGRLGIGGDSHGATLATVACRRLRDAGQPVPALQLLLCPVLDLSAETPSRREFDGYLIDRKTLAWAIEQYCPPGTTVDDPRISPLRAPDFAGLPPAHIHTAEFDPMRDEGKAYAEAIADAGVGVHYVCHDGMIHHFYAMAGAIPNARIAVEAVGAAVGGALLGASPE